MVLCVSMSVRLAGGPPGRRSLAVPLDGTFEHTTDIGSLNSSRSFDKYPYRDRISVFIRGSSRSGAHEAAVVAGWSEQAGQAAARCHTFI